jgi:hypothetical protein
MKHLKTFESTEEKIELLADLLTENPLSEDHDFYKMKHVKDIKLFEVRKFKPFRKYIDILTDKFDANVCEVYELEGVITIWLEYYNEIDKETFLLFYEHFSDTQFRILKGSTRMKFEAVGVPRTFFEELDFEIDAKNYNL